MRGVLHDAESTSSVREGIERMDVFRRKRSERRPGRPFIVAKAMSGHFAYFKLVIDVVDGKVRQTAEEELTCESECAIVVAELALAASLAVADQAA
jgi:hypothetical protein